MHVGITGDREIVVTKAMLASSAGSGLVDVFATPIMIAEIEGTVLNNIIKNMKKLQEQNIIKRIGADKNGYWQIVDKK